MMTEIVMEKRPLAEITTVLGDVPEYRKFMVRLMAARYLYIEGGFPKPVDSLLPNKRKHPEEEEEKVEQSVSSEFIPPRNKRDIKQLDKAESQVGSMVSRASTKSKSGHLHKHCCLCNGKRIAGNNWAKHIGSVH